MHSLIDIPKTPKQLTPKFLSDVLGCEVVSSTAQRIGEDEGFTGGGLYRILLTYASDTVDAPLSVVAKFSPTDETMRTTFAAANEREIDFYTQFSRGAELPLPKCFFGQLDQDTATSLLIIDDLGELRTVGFIEGCSAAEALSVVDALAQIHGAFWSNPSVAQLCGPEILHEFDFQAAWKKYPEKVSQVLPHFRIPKWFFELCQFISDNDQTIFTHLMATQPLTLIHRDPHVDNILFGDTSSEKQAVLLDWQIMGKGKGVFDLAYFLISSLEPELRRRIEFSMLTRYHDDLVRQGINDYSFDQCRKDFLASVVGKIFITVVATALLDNSSPHKVSWRKTDLTRLLAFCEDNHISKETFAFMLP
jgi:hypothetical protein